MPVTNQSSDQIARNNEKVRGMVYIGELPEGSDWTPHPCGDGVIIVHPDHPPKWLHDDGRIEEMGFVREEPPILIFGAAGLASREDIFGTEEGQP
jgi:hypothetical protein